MSTFRESVLLRSSVVMSLLVLAATIGCVSEVKPGGAGASAAKPAGGEPGMAGGTMAGPGGAPAMGGPAEMAAELSGNIDIDGSSTVYPIMESVASAFEKLHPKVKITIGKTGTGTGMSKFAKGEIAFANASRPITEKETEQCKANNIDYVEFNIAIDGLTVAVNPENDWCDCITTDELKKIWSKDSTVTLWSDVRPDWPAQKIELYGPDTASGTFEYFTEVVNGKKKESRGDYTPSSEDSVLVRGIATNKYALGYFGYSYYIENAKKLKALAISDGKSAVCVKPSAETIESGEYSPLSRPLFVYVTKAALAKPEVAAVVSYLLSDAGQGCVSERGCIRQSAAVLAKMREVLAAAK